MQALLNDAYQAGRDLKTVAINPTLQRHIAQTWTKPRELGQQSLFTKLLIWIGLKPKPMPVAAVPSNVDLYVSDFGMVLFEVVRA